MSDPGGDQRPTRRSYSDAEAAADLATYRELRRSASVRSLLVVAIVALLLLRWLPHPAFALVGGGICGVFNTLLTMHSGERLIDTRRVGGFVISSFLRIGVFGIVPVAFAALGPGWSMACYFAGFFLPLAMFARDAHRAHVRK